MRTFKFRAWDKKKEKWLFGYELPSLGGFNLTGEVVLLGELGTIPLQDWNHIEVMQFTGLIDKNGKEIYESDRVTICDVNGENWQGLVEWNQNSADYEVMNETFGFQRAFGIEGDDYEVVGNLYEN